ncbi:MAG: hypothetical protein Q9201_003062 [Fulgogasparrea decipioides]
MNNSQFRRLVLDTPSTAPKGNGSSNATSGSKPAATPTALGSRMRSNIPMTPRSVASGAHVDFARQLAERDASLNPSSTKKFRSSAAPKGTKLGSGYQDRTQLRTSAEEDEKASRVKALEEMVKLGQMERATFETLRDEIIGGDVKDVHLVKGLDWKLLERVRRGEDVLSGASAKAAAAETPSPTNEVDMDEEFEKLEERHVQPTAKQATAKKGEMAPPLPPAAGKKRTRDEILKELKASRQAAAEKAEQARQPTLGPKFRKLGEKKAKSRIEKDERGRDVLITVDAEGNVKRKVKKAKTEATADNHGLLMPDKDTKPLGSDVTVPEPQAASEEQGDGDIFEGVGADYNPLGGEDLEDGTSDDSEAEDRTKLPAKAKETIKSPSSTNAVPLPKQTSGLKNYFREPSGPSESTKSNTTPFQDPTILAALKKASTLDPLSSSSEPSTSEEALKLARRNRMLESRDRDAEDMDLGFGSSRFEDEADDGDLERKVKLSVWGKEGREEEGRGDGKVKRKRGPKKRKGDKDSAADVLKVLERRKGKGE